MRRLAAVGLLLASVAARADLCDGPCRIVLDFADGGTLATGGATITFSSGGELTLGTGGSITLGTGGSLTPDVDPPDMSNGGTLVLGAGGSVQFGTGGRLDTGSAGNISLNEGTQLAASGAASATIDATQSVHLGDLDTDGTATVTAGGQIDQPDDSSPIHIDTTGPLTVSSDADVTLSSVSGATVNLSPAPAAGGGGGFCGDDCPQGGSTLGPGSIPTESGTFSSTNTGSLGLLHLLPLLLLGRLRRR